jgi:hypothetical protein
MLTVKSSIVPYHASKWLSVALLIDAAEMKELFSSLGNFFIFTIGSTVKRGEGPITHESFLSCYANYIEILKSGNIPEDSIYRPMFASVLTVSSDHLYAMHVGTDKELIRINKPVIQLQAHNLDYSVVDGKFRSMVLGKDSVLWGLQFSYPQLYEDPQNYTVHKVDDNFPNTSLFRALQKWMRLNTVPTPFIVDEKTINVPMRLGKSCFSWINNHPQLKKKGLRVILNINSKYY